MRDLALRPWREEDAATVLAAFSSPEMARQADEPVGDAEDAVVVDGNGTALGNASVGEVNRIHGTGWVSYWTAPDARGGGVAAYGCGAVARWAFRELGLFRLEVGHRTNNPASCRVAHAAGFAPEGVQRQKLMYDGVRYDVELHARLASDAGFP
ncbi:GNAT family N-acetyltransferase [Streptomyces sp. NPDC003032]